MAPEKSMQRRGKIVLLGWGVVFAFLLTGAGILVGSLSYLFTEIRSHESETIFITTEDGWTLALHHYQPLGSTKRQHPVLICHGITSNRHTWEVTDRISFPRYLAARGFDTWVLELRGSGVSEKPTWFGSRRANYTFDDYALYDLPAAINEVAQRTQSSQLHWVGHSMGSMLLYAYLERIGDHRIRSATALGAPAFVSDANVVLNRAVSLFPFGEFLLDEFPAGLLSKMGGWLAYPDLVPYMHLFWNYDNISESTARLAATHAVDNLPATVVEQFVRAAKQGYLSSADGTINYTKGLENITVPFLFVAGALDQLAPPGAVIDAYQRVNSPKKKISILSQANGYKHDYGHVDLTLGEAAPDEVFPLVWDWLVDND